MTWDYSSQAAGSPDAMGDSGITPHSAVYQLQITLGEDQSILHAEILNNKTMQSNVYMPNPSVMKVLVDQCRIDNENPVLISIHSEYKRNGCLLRAHSNYRGTGPWNDWVVFRWQKAGVSNRARQQFNRSVLDSQVHYGDNDANTRHYDYAPGKLLGFVQCPQEGDESRVLAIAQCCEFTHKKNSIFSTEWKLEDPTSSNGFHAVDVDSIVRPCLMLPQDLDKGIYNEIWAQERWGKEFM
jgi:hypothetical protein